MEKEALMVTHVKVIAVLFLVFGALGLIGAFFSGLVFGWLAGIVGLSGDPDAATGAAALGFVGTFLTVLFVVLSLPNVICGIYLLKFRPWARILAIVMAIISLIHVPFGTIFGVYALVVLFQKETEALFASNQLPAFPSTVDRA
jgi:hypothetical protein